MFNQTHELQIKKQGNCLMKTLAHNPSNALSAGKKGHKRRFFTKKKVAFTLLTLVLLLVIASLGIGFYFSNVLLQLPPRGPETYGMDLTNVTSPTLTLPRNHDTEQPGIFGLDRANVQAQVGIITSVPTE